QYPPPIMNRDTPHIEISPCVLDIRSWNPALREGCPEGAGEGSNPVPVCVDTPEGACRTGPSSGAPRHPLPDGEGKAPLPNCRSARRQRGVGADEFFASTS